MEQVTIDHGNPPKTLMTFLNRHADKVMSISDERGFGDPMFICLRRGWCWDDEGLHTISERTAKDVIYVFDRVKSCNCECCRIKNS